MVPRIAGKLTFISATSSELYWFHGRAVCAYIRSCISRLITALYQICQELFCGRPYRRQLTPLNWGLCFSRARPFGDRSRACPWVDARAEASDGRQDRASEPQGDGGSAVRATARRPTRGLHALRLENTKHPRSGVLHDLPRATTTTAAHRRLALPANGVGHIARAEAGPGRRAGGRPGEVEAHPQVRMWPPGRPGRWRAAVMSAWWRA